MGADPKEPDPEEPDLQLPVSPLPPDYYTDDGVPTFDAVRERIEGRSAQALGNEELDAASESQQSWEEEQEKLKQAGKDRLEQLRKQMGL